MMKWVTYKMNGEKQRCGLQAAFDANPTCAVRQFCVAITVMEGEGVVTGKACLGSNVESFGMF